jgi:hypothetical protein
MQYDKNSYKKKINNIWTNDFNENSNKEGSINNEFDRRIELEKATIQRQLPEPAGGLRKVGDNNPVAEQEGTRNIQKCNASGDVGEIEKRISTIEREIRGNNDINSNENMPEPRQNGGNSSELEKQQRINDGKNGGYFNKTTNGNSREH